MSAMLSDHLSLAEFTATSHREFLDAQANPPPEVLANARRLAVDVFEPTRALAGRLHVNSGWRCPDLNAAVGGVPTSAHVDGRALDLVPLEAPMLAAFQRLAASEVPYDQLIWEFGRWIHLACARHAEAPRRQVLMTFGGGRYEPFDIGDARVGRFA